MKGKMVYLKVEALKAIKFVEMELGAKGFVTLKGDNGVGKSTVIEAIETLLKGGKLPDGLIQKGKKEAYVEAAFNDGTRAVRRVRKKKDGSQATTLEVFKEDGTKVPSPQTFLKSLFSGFVSPSSLVNASGATLYSHITKAFPVDLDKYAESIEHLKGQNKLHRAMIKSLGIMEKPEEVEAVVFDFKAYQDLAERHEEHTKANAEIDRNEKRIEDLEDEIKMLRTQNKSLERGLDFTLGRKLTEMEDLHEKADASRDAVAAMEKYAAHVAERSAINRKIKRGEEGLANLLIEVRDALSSVKMPGGINVDIDRNVFIDETPWENAAYSEKLKAAILLQLSSLDKEKLPIVFIEHGETMNKAKREEIAKVAIEQGALVFIEMFDETIDHLIISHDDNQFEDKEAPAVEEKEYDKPEEAPEYPDGPDYEAF